MGRPGGTVRPADLVDRPTYRLDAADAEDAAQNVWLKLLGHLGSLRDPAALPGWLATTSAGMRPRPSRGAGPGNAGHAPDAGTIPNDHARTAEKDLLVAEQHAALREALGHLPPGCHQLITLLIHDSALSYAEISTKLGIQVDSIGPSRSCLDKMRRRADQRRPDRLSLDPPINLCRSFLPRFVLGEFSRVDAGVKAPPLASRAACP
jgi:DNA-directed RNA polymerase specialized sigma24 family protein